MLQHTPHRRLSTLAITALLSGCGGLFDAGTIEETCNDLPQGCNGGGDGGSGDTGTPIDLAVDSVDPEYGPTAGGTSVTITGGPFTSDATVSFGGVDATVRSWTDSTLQVDTPAIGNGDWVDVTVQTGEGEGSLSHAYRYFEDGGGKTSLLGYFSYTESVGALAGAGNLAHASLQFIQPEAGATWWTTVTSAINTCELNWDGSPTWLAVDPGADSLRITRSDGDTIDLAWDSAEKSFNGTDGDGDVPADILLPDTIWSVASFDSDELPSFGLSGLATMPGAFTLTSPDLDGYSTPVVKEKALDFYWTASGADAVIIDMRLVDGGTGAEVERVTCAVDDDGSFHVPANTFTQWAANLVLYVKVGPGVESHGVVELDGSESRVLATYLLSGAATTE